MDKLSHLSQIPRAHAFVFVLVSGVTVFTDIAIAVASGVIISALVFAWEIGLILCMKESTSAETH